MGNYLNKDATDSALDELFKRGSGAKLDEWMQDALDNDASGGELAKKMVEDVYAASLEFKEVMRRMDILNQRGRESEAQRIFREEWMVLHRAQSDRERRLTGMGITSEQIMGYFREQEVGVMEEQEDEDMEA